MGTRTLVMTAAVALGVLAAVGVRASVGGSTGASGFAASSSPAATGSTRPCPLDILDMLPVWGFAHGVTPEDIAESARLEREYAARMPPPSPAERADLPPNARQRLDWACNGFAHERAEHHGALLGEPEESATPLLPEATECTRYCRLFASCGGPAVRATGDPWNCNDACVAGDFGLREWIRQVADLGSCRYL